jgi:hypothetical protein
MFTRAQRSASKENPEEVTEHSDSQGESASKVESQVVVEMSRSLPSFSEFNASVEDVDSYVERLERYFVVNKIADDKEKVNIFITLVGPETYGLVKRLVSPVKPSAKTFPELVAVLKKHFAPDTNVLAERFKFGKEINVRVSHTWTMQSS